jgi:hypothetical protein
MNQGAILGTRGSRGRETELSQCVMTQEGRNNSHTLTRGMLQIQTEKESKRRATTCHISNCSNSNNNHSVFTGERIAPCDPST